MPDNEQKDDPPVGYGVPPTSTRFPPGVSGNPSGKKKKAVVNTFAEALAEEGDRKVTVRIDGKNRRVSMRQLTARQLWSKAASGVGWAIAIIAKNDIKFKDLAMTDEYPTYEVTLVFDGEEKLIN